MSGHERSAGASRTRAGLLLIGGLSVLAGGCVDQPAEQATYRNELSATAPPSHFYDGQRDLPLVDALSYANDHNERLAQSGEDYLQALIAENRAVAGFLPTIAFQPSFTIEQTPRTASNLQQATGSNTTTGSGGTGTGTGASGGTTGTNTGTGGTGSGVTGVGGTTGGAVNSASATLVTSGFRRLSGQSVYNIQAPVVGSINLFRGGFDVQNLKSTEKVAEQRRQELLDVQTTILLNVAQTYYAILRSERAVEVLTNSLRVQEARLSDVTQQFNNGLATRLDVAQTRAQVDATRVTLVNAEGDVNNGRSTLALLIGVDHVTGRLSDEFATPTDVPAEQDYEREALRSRQDLKAAFRATEAAQYRVKAAIAQYYPSVTLNLEGFLFREYYSDASKWSALLNVNLPIFTAGIIEADVRTAWSELRQAALNEQYARRQVVTDVRTSYQNLTTSDKRIRALVDEVQAANEAFSQSQGAFRNNLAINLDVLTAQDQLLTSQLDLAGAQYDRTVYFLDLLRSSGTLTVNQVIAILNTPGPTTRPILGPVLEGAAGGPAGSNAPGGGNAAGGAAPAGR